MGRRRPRVLGTIADYGRFIRAWINGGELDGARILKEETVDLAVQDHLDGVPLPPKLAPTVPELANPVELLPVPQGWGLGFHVYLIDLPGMRSAGSGDWSGLFNSFFWIDRKAGIGAVIATQLLPFFDAKMVETILTFEAAVYAELAATVGRSAVPELSVSPDTVGSNSPMPLPLPSRYPARRGSLPWSDPTTRPYLRSSCSATIKPSTAANKTRPATGRDGRTSPQCTSSVRAIPPCTTS